MQPVFTSLVALVAAGACLSPTVALAQDQLSPDEAAALRNEIATLRAQLQKMERRLDAVTNAPLTTAPAAPPARRQGVPMTPPGGVVLKTAPRPPGA